ncbi:hypothetical protein C8J56DRAFT_884190 [Mycena floridula]|nr:hypothetical protein C8J56DRAFT_884190 [Mycena floridula]
MLNGLAGLILGASASVGRSHGWYFGTTDLDRYLVLSVSETLTTFKLVDPADLPEKESQIRRKLPKSAQEGFLDKYFKKDRIRIEIKDLALDTRTNFLHCLWQVEDCGHKVDSTSPPVERPSLPSAGAGDIDDEQRGR